MGPMESATSDAGSAPKKQRKVTVTKSKLILLAEQQANKSRD